MKKIEEIRARLEHAKAANFLPLLGDSEEYHKNMHELLDRIILGAVDRDLGAKSEDDVEEQKEGAAAKEYRDFVDEVNTLEIEIAEAIKEEAAGERQNELIEKFEKLLEEGNKKHGDMTGVFKNAMATIKLDLLMDKDPSQIGASLEDEEAQRILAKLVDQPWKYSICEDLLGVKRQLRLVQVKHGLNFEEHFNRLKRKLQVSVVDCEYSSLAKMKKPDLCKKLEDCERDCNVWLGQLTNNTKDVTPKDFKTLVKPLGKIQEKLDIIMVSSDKEKKKYDSINFDPVVMGKKLGGLFQTLFRFLAVRRKPANVAGGSAANDGPFLYMPKRNSKTVAIYNIPEKSFSEVTVDFTFPRNSEMAITHVSDEVYFAGGYGDGPAGGYWDHFHKLNSDGELTKMPTMPKAKSWFPMPYYEEEEQLITVGGYDQNNAQEEVYAYSLKEEKWNNLPNLPKKLYGSAAGILDGNALYNLGGNGSSDSVIMLRLGDVDAKWQTLNLAGHNFANWYYRDALVVGDQIIFWGTQNKNATFILERKDGEDELHVVLETGSIEYQVNYDKDVSCKVFEDEIYAFPSNQYSEVQKFDLTLWNKDS